MDYERRIQLLEENRHLALDAAKVEDWLAVQDERLKFYLTTRLLKFRKEHERLFEEGSYRELELIGGCESWIVFSRECEEEVLLVIVPRLQGKRDACAPEVKLEGDLQGRVWKDVLAGWQLESQDRIDLGAIGVRFAVLHSGAKRK